MLLSGFALLVTLWLPDQGALERVKQAEGLIGTYILAGRRGIIPGIELCHRLPVDQPAFFLPTATSASMGLARDPFPGTPGAQP